ncbi:MAG TPA: signal peptidase I [Chloroflexota bacterium]
MRATTTAIAEAASIVQSRATEVAAQATVAAAVRGTVTALAPSPTVIASLSPTSSEDESCSFVQQGAAMEPTLKDGQFLIVLTGNRHPNRGDVVLFRYPLDPSKSFVKRVIGIAGDTVEVRTQQTIVDGKVMSEPYIKSAENGLYPPTVVPTGQYFVLGDNRNNSSDSRSFGMVPAEDIVGIVAASPTGEPSHGSLPGCSGGS